MSGLQIHDGLGTGLPSRVQRGHNAAVARVVANTKLTALKVDAEAAVTGRVMERVVDIDGYRRALAGDDDETLNAVLTRIEMGFIAKAEQIQRGFGSEFGL